MSEPRLPKFEFNIGSESNVREVVADIDKFSSVVELAQIWAAHLNDLVDEYDTSVYDQYLRRTPTVDRFLAEHKPANTPLTELQFWRSVETQLAPIKQYMDNKKISDSIALLKIGFSGVHEKTVVEDFRERLAKGKAVFETCEDAVKYLTYMEDYVKTIRDHDTSEWTLQPVVDALDPLFSVLRMSWISSRVYGINGRELGSLYSPEKLKHVPRDGITNFKQILTQISHMLGLKLEVSISKVPGSVTADIRSNNPVKRFCLEGRDACLKWKELYTEVKIQLENLEAYPLWEFGENFENMLTEKLEYIHDRCADLVDVIDMLQMELNKVKSIKGYQQKLTQKLQSLSNRADDHELSSNLVGHEVQSYPPSVVSSRANSTLLPPISPIGSMVKQQEAPTVEDLQTVIDEQVELLHEIRFEILVEDNFTEWETLYERIKAKSLIFFQKAGPLLPPSTASSFALLSPPSTVVL
eukprot:TRINITY_DN66816_c7_g1_i1.p1 TRINITY_DN66816_c7_g1~~TRINITY_DN66816_c7_g1_i1.p1  ORF type:complete len:469 (-),score=41.58 TRINITY_DN66816_c7_g1_i1:1446-2852(-)